MNGQNVQSCAISVVICTQNRSADLDRCLAALERQTLSPSSFEVVIVDNGSKDDTPGVVARYCDRLPHFRGCFEPRAGLSIARNTGIAMSFGDIIAYTDDDAEAHPEWVERILARFRELGGSVGIVGGEVVPRWGGSRPDWLTDQMMRPLSAGLFWGTEARMLRSGEWLIEVNSAYRREALELVGGFPEKLGRIGDILLSGDGVCNQLIQMAGYGLYFDPEILVDHHISAGRLTKSWFRKRSFWQGVSENRSRRYVEEKAGELGLGRHPRRARQWEEVEIPTSALAWTELFDDHGEENFSDQLYRIEQFGYFLESQKLVVG